MDQFSSILVFRGVQTRWGPRCSAALEVGESLGLLSVDVRARQFWYLIHLPPRRTTSLKATHLASPSLSSSLLSHLLTTDHPTTHESIHNSNKHANEHLDASRNHIPTSNQVRRLFLGPPLVRGQATFCLDRSPERSLPSLIATELLNQPCITQTPERDLCDVCDASFILPRITDELRFPTTW
jgi:hypothetical protein